MSKRKRTPRAEDSRVITLRCSPEVEARLEAHVKRMAGAVPGVRWTRSSAALNLLVRALDQVEAQEPR
jgi:hypothetical protein